MRMLQLVEEMVVTIIFLPVQLESGVTESVALRKPACD